MAEENLKELLSRRTIRRYTNQEIKEEDLKRILQAGIRASNCGNMQLLPLQLKQAAGQDRLGFIV